MTIKYNETATKRSDDKQSWQPFPKQYDNCYPNLPDYTFNLHGC